ncbi:MAG TPA: PhoPQ-activated protein PqaA family protein [Candidatus Hydrogenedentes bacterium]|nr:PhoPQ-activated protein PqaA family protein [Candidatus Hydrogenedentota bacterium]
MARNVVWRVILGTFLLMPGVVYATALDDYVAAPDPAYTYTLSDTIDGDGYTVYVIRMTSQTWRSSSEVNHTVWKHWLTIGVPDVVTNDTGLLAIGGGSNTASPSDMEPYLGMVITATGSILGYLEQVPNEPLRFSDESISRTEDAIIAYSFDKYMTTGDPTWPVLLPMVKSAVRALDTMTTVAADHGVTLNKYVIGGGSKRGWTTYLTAAVDPRIAAMAPIVFDASNMSPSMIHHYQCYGGYSSAIHDYNDLHIFERMDTPEGTALRGIVDPYTYFDRYTMPKLCVTATGDEFFVLDSSQFYFSQLPGEKHYRTVPNSGHGIETDMSSIVSLFQYYITIATNQPRPEFSWTFEENGAIHVNTVTAPTSVKLWQATNPSARDFRWYSGSGPQWTSSTLGEDTPGSGTYTANVPPPATGWSAFYIALTFSDGTAFSTEIRVTPPWLPYGDVDNDGTLNHEDDDMDDDGIPNDEDICAWDHTPWIDPPVPDIETAEDTPFEYVLTPHENDLENTGELLTWAASGMPESLFDVEIDAPTDTLTLTPAPDANGPGSFTLTLSDPKGQTATQEVLVTILPMEEEGEGGEEGEGAPEEGQSEGLNEGEGGEEGEGAPEEGQSEGLSEGEGGEEGEGEPPVSCSPPCTRVCADEGFDPGAEDALRDIYDTVESYLHLGYDGDTSDIDANGLIDSAQARLLDVLLADASHPAFCCVKGAWDNNYAQADVYVEILKADPLTALIFFLIPEVELEHFLTGVVTLGEESTYNALLDILDAFPDLPRPDFNLFDRSAEPYLASYGDADLDAVCNLGEYNATVTTGVEQFDAFVTAVLNPEENGDGGGCGECPAYEGQPEGEGSEMEGGYEGEVEGEVGCPALCEHDWADGCSSSDAPPVENFWRGSGQTDVTFIAFGDSHFMANGADRNLLNVNAMNALDTVAQWSGAPFDFEEPVSHVRGVILAGDITNDGVDGRYRTSDEIQEFIDIYGLCGNHLLKYPIFEGYGNHDYFQYNHLGYRLFEAHPVVDMVSQRNPYRAGLINAAPEADGHYSWEWDNIHFVQLNLKPSDLAPETSVPGACDPRSALSFLQSDLAQHVAGTHKRLVIISHYGFYSSWDFNGWWTTGEAEAYYDVVKDYDIIAHIHGHAHQTGYYTWHGIPVFNAGSPFYNVPSYNPDGRGHFSVFRVTNDHLYAADASWNPANPETDIDFPDNWAVSIPLTPIEEGETEGIEEGLPEGSEEGLSEGLEEGISEGLEEGMSEGTEEGLAEGTDEGILEGVEEGLIEGTEEGLAEGVEEGLIEGLEEGLNEGVEEGLIEGEGEGVEDGQHSADQNGDHQISLSELLRIIQFYNSDGYHCETGTEDGYAPGPGSQTCTPHDSDYNPQDWTVDLSELLRIIQFYNSGGYHACEGSEDGFCPGL